MKKNAPDRIQRRRFIKQGLTALAVVPLGSVIHRAEAGAAKLEESDPTAVALGYVHDATKTDTAKFPKRKGPEGEKQFCDNCSLYAGKEGEEWGGCSIFGGKLVNAKGWCNAWVPK